MKDIISQKIYLGLSPAKLEVIDESHLHHGHSGSKPGGETHFKLIIKDAEIAKKSKIDTHRRIHHLLKSELASQIHALSIIIIAN
jgi:BolA protein